MAEPLPVKGGSLADEAKAEAERRWPSIAATNRIRNQLAQRAFLQGAQFADDIAVQTRNLMRVALEAEIADRDAQIAELRSSLRELERSRQKPEPPSLFRSLEEALADVGLRQAHSLTFEILSTQSMVEWARYVTQEKEENQ